MINDSRMKLMEMMMKLPYAKIGAPAFYQYLKVLGTPLGICSKNNKEVGKVDMTS
jgi:hypothetical protein